MPDHMLIDARNALYRSIHAMRAESLNKGQAVHAANSITCLMRMLVKWINNYRPKSVHVFWDAPRTTVWRRKVYPGYKDRSESDYVANIADELKVVTDLAKEAFSYLNIRQYDKACMEADDLIFATTTLLHPETSVIVSTDSDMVQIPFIYPSCTVYDPKKDMEVPVPDHSPAMLKSLVGDDADTIPGYYGIGPVKGAALLKNRAKLFDYINENDRKIFLRNQILIDLSLCPNLLANKIYSQGQLAEPTVFDKVKFKDMITKYKISGILQEYGFIIAAFKDLK